MLSIPELYQLHLPQRRVTTDSRNVPAGSIFFALRGDRFNGNQYAAGALEHGAAYAVVDDAAVAEAIGERAVLCHDVLTTLQKLANHHRRQLRMPVLAITGSNGKTTTKELVAAVMSRRYTIHATPGNFNNHIGLPLTILQIGPEVEMAILEMGANHQGEIAELCRIAEPTHGLITNIGEAHLEGFGGIEGVKIGKGELYDYLAKNGGVAFVNLDADFLPEMARKIERRIDYLRSDQPARATLPMECRLLAAAPNVRLSFLSERDELVEANSNLPGLHNFENLKTAVAIGKYFKVAGLDIKQAIENYVPSDNRSQRITHRNIPFWLDAYNANPSSVAASLSAFCSATPSPRAAILGNMLELGVDSETAHRHIANLASALDLEKVILVGPAYAATAESSGLPWFKDLPSLKNWFWEQDWSDYTVLLKGSRGVGLERLLK